MKETSNSTLSACLIVKNEEKLLPNCLKSVKGVADEIIVVDTGSTDDTVLIAKNYGAKVYFHPWNDSFSEARNHAISHATKDWILMLDADEELEQTDIHLLHQAINNQKYNGVIISILSTIKGSIHKFYYTRIFRRGKAFYKDIIHEQIIIDGERLPTEIRLYHHGYDLDIKIMQKKWETTTKLLKKQLQVNRYDSFAWFNFIRNYRTQERFQDGINAGKEALEIITPEANPLHYTKILYEIANCYLPLENYTEAKKVCNTALTKLKELHVTPENIDIIYTLACTCLKQRNYREAIEYFHHFLTLRESHLQNADMGLMTDTLGYDYSAYNGIGYCFGNLGQWQLAIDFLRKAVNANTKYLASYQNLATCLSAYGEKTEAIETLLNTISEGIADQHVFSALGELYIDQKEYDKAITFFEEYLKLNPEDNNALLKISWCYEKLGYHEAAMIGYRSIQGN